MIPFRRAVTTVALLLGTILAGAQTRTVVLSGYVRDAESGEPLPQAVVYLEDKKTGVAADGVGFVLSSRSHGKAHRLLLLFRL
jgi:hypothetical protein